MINIITPVKRLHAVGNFFEIGRRLSGVGAKAGPGAGAGASTPERASAMSAKAVEELLLGALFTEGSPSLARVIDFLDIHDVAQAVLAVAIGRLAASGRLGKVALLPHMLEEIKCLHFVSTLSVAGAASLAWGCKKLRDLNLKNTDATDAVVRSLAEGCKELRKLNLEACDKVTDAGVKSLEEGCKERQIFM